MSSAGWRRAFIALGAALVLSLAGPVQAQECDRILSWRASLIAGGHGFLRLTLQPDPRRSDIERDFAATRFLPARQMLVGETFGALGLEPFLDLQAEEVVDLARTYASCVPQAENRFDQLFHFLATTRDTDARLLAGRMAVLVRRDLEALQVLAEIVEAGRNYTAPGGPYLTRTRLARIERTIEQTRDNWTEAQRDAASAVLSELRALSAANHAEFRARRDEIVARGLGR